ncbi:hypothetical protein phytr_7000 [Candidatus Phycorickettsia trachydisci]|uniref:Adhesin domain-containing protein n=1 Tax=Candidatus Phycorickettsia trachydisci TaxID=2115978 RepID=A0A2P1P8Q7_9RICK|nr:hypothetical protein [Candidatus Phycorickettsia trachydisci]AVP87641.1 hypothetical protein phytr_7000 [Candidatus Phycorickettsia trachydisci]
MRIFSALLLLFTLPSLGQETRSFTGSITDLIVEIDEGEIVIEGSKDQNTIVDYITSRENCNTQTIKNDNTIQILNNKYQNGCQASYNVKLSSNVKVNIKIGAGDVKVSNLDATTQISGGSGNISLSDVTKNVSIKLGTGNVEFKTNLEPLKPLDTKLEIGTGNISYLLPKNSIIKNSIKSLPGASYIDGNFKYDNMKYDFNLDIKLGVGYISVKPVETSE